MIKNGLKMIRKIRTANNPGQMALKIGLLGNSHVTGKEVATYQLTFPMQPESDLSSQ